MYIVEAEVNGIMKKITTEQGDPMKFKLNKDAWDYLYQAFGYEYIYIDGIRTKTKEIKSLAVNYES